MALIKTLSSKNEITTIIDSIIKEEKTKENLITGINCTPKTAKEEMKSTREIWKKDSSIKYRQFIQSYAENDNITPEQAHNNAIELAKKTEAWQGYQVLIATHTDRQYIHSHIIVNSVNIENGQKLRWTKKDYAGLKSLDTEQCLLQGLSSQLFFHEKIFKKIYTYKIDAYQTLKRAENGEYDSYIRDIAVAIIISATQATSKEEFIRIMNGNGFGVDWKNEYPYITFTDLDREEQEEKLCKIRNIKIENYYRFDFSKERLEKNFIQNAKELTKKNKKV